MVEKLHREIPDVSLGKKESDVGGYGLTIALRCYY
jgi:hypothetical protein